MPYNTKEKKKAHNQRYFKSWYENNGRNRNLEYKEIIYEWQQEHPDRVKASRELRAAVKSGKLIKPTNCEFCGRKTRLSGHHIDYSQPLCVYWLCSSCHKLLHIKADMSEFV